MDSTPPLFPDNTTASAGAQFAYPLLNARDLGGYRGAGGRLIRRGILFRSGEPVALGPDEHAWYDALDLAAVFDLRSSGERLRRPCELAHKPSRRLVARNYRFTDTDLVALLREHTAKAEAVPGTMISTYRQIPYVHAESYRTVLQMIANSELPLLFCCAAGKDRTGVLAALIMALVGVSRRDIIAEYEQTNANRSELRQRLRRHVENRIINEQVWEGLLAAEPTYLDAAFDEVEQRHGGAAGYVSDYLGLDPSVIDSLRRTLLDDDPDR